jgi:hypothetical protein
MSAGGPTGQPGGQAPPQGPAYGGPAWPYGPGASAGGPTGQPGGQAPPQGPAYQQAQPGHQQAQPGPDQQTAGFNAEQYGRIADVMGDIANGEQPDMNKLVSLFNGFDSQFWKGALIGAVITVLMTNETVRSAVADVVSGIMGAFKKDETNTGGDSAPETDAT